MYFADSSYASTLLYSVLFHCRHSELNEDQDSGLISALNQFDIINYIVPLLEADSVTFPSPNLPEELNEFFSWLDRQVIPQLHVSQKYLDY